MPQHLTIELFGFGSVGSGIYHTLKKKNIPNISIKKL